MNRNNEIRMALDRARGIVEANPSRATGTVSLKLEMGEAIKCTTEVDGWTLEIDEPASMGGDNSAPGPYVYGFSAIASCFAMSIRMLAVQAGVSVESISIDVEGDYDDRAFFDLADARTGYQTVRLKVNVASDAGHGEIEALVTEARRKSPWLNTFAHQNSIETELVRDDGAALG
jgi:uncharacterized OsmC-like protein